MMKTHNNTVVFAKRLKEARQKKKLTQAKLAELTNTTATTVSKYEAGSETSKPSLELAITFSKALGVSLDWLCGTDQNSVKSTQIVNLDVKSYLYSLVKVVTELSTETEEKLFAGKNSMHIIITQNCLISFVNKVKDLLKVYRDGSLTKDLYVTCIDKVINDYSDYVFDYDNFLSTEEQWEAYEYITQVFENVDDYGEKLTPSIIEANFNNPNCRAESLKLFISQDYIDYYQKHNTEAKDLETNPPKTTS